MKYQIISLSLLFLLSCTQKSTNPSSAKDSPKIFKLTTNTGKSIILEELRGNGESLSTITIKPKGFEFGEEIIMQESDPIHEVFVTDLDNNGYDELYIVSQSVGSGSYSTLKGFASNKDKSITEINIQNDYQDKQIFHGFMGHNSFHIDGAKLSMTYPVYLENDTNNTPTGGKRIINYILEPGEAAWQLKINSADYEDFQLAYLEEFPMEVMGCSCIFSKNEADFGKRQYFSVQTFGTSNPAHYVSVLNINGDKIVHKGDPNKNPFQTKITYDPDPPPSGDQDVQKKSGSIMITEVSSMKVIFTKFVGVCAC